MNGAVTVQKTRPESAVELTQLADRHLRRAGVTGILPTPIEVLIANAKIHEVCDPEDAREGFLASLPERARTRFQAIWQKLRGIADLREDVIYVPTSDTPPRLLWVRSHEFGHQVIPWHKVSIYPDDDLSLRPDAEALFDVEANFFAGELIFQGHQFRARASDYRPSFAAVFLLADTHGASRQATLRRYVEDHDEMLAFATYLPSRFTLDAKGNRELQRPWVIASSAFRRRYPDLRLPDPLPPDHDWSYARDKSEVCIGESGLHCGHGEVQFDWQSWWNGYSLFVLLRRKPVLSIVGRLLRRG